MSIQTLRALVTSFIPGSRLVDGGDCLNLFNLTLGSAGSATLLTALAGGGAVGATLLVAGINNVAVVATNGDSTLLPQALPGTIVVLINNGNGSTTTFGEQVDINTGVAATIAAHGSTNQTNNGVSTASAAVSIFFCFANGEWKQTLLT